MLDKPRESRSTRHVIAYIGAWCCLAVELLGLGECFYWRYITGDFGDPHIVFWEPIGFGGLVGIFIFTRIVGGE